MSAPWSRRALARRIKRAIDVAGAAAGLIVLSPVYAAVALAVRRELGSPVLFRQRRPGLRGMPFDLIKFRTMRPAPAGVSGTAAVASDGERLTRLGRLLREMSLDELPTLWNVLRGDMSLVGPRPLLMEYLARYTDEQRRRHDMPPGVTGWAQVNVRNAAAWDNKLSFDLWYVDHWSLRLDLAILLRTIGRVVRREGINAPGSPTMPEFRGESGSTPVIN